MVKKGPKGKGKKASVAASPDRKPQPVEDVVEEAQTQLLFGNYDRAMEIMRELRAAHPDNAEVLDVSFASNCGDSGSTNPFALADARGGIQLGDANN